MKKIFVIFGMPAAMMILFQGDIFAQDTVKETGLSFIMVVELIVFLLIIGLIFFPLMGKTPESHAGQVTSGSVAAELKPASMPGFVADIRFGKMLKLAIIITAALAIIHLLIVILLLT